MAAGARPSRFVAMLRLRCPRCLQGRVFRGLLEMNEACPRCGLVFGREEGYFTGAMYVSYLFSLAALFGIFVVLWAIFGARTLFTVGMMVLVSTALYLPLVPVVYRYSRVVWMYLDRAVDKRWG